MQRVPQPTSATPRSPAGPRAWLPGALLLTAAALVAYANVIRGGFIWDDNVFVINNPLIREPGRFWQIWFTREAADYWPLSYSFFWVAWRLFGENPAGYHLCNIALHAICAVLLWRVLRASGLRWGLLAALVFVVHPVNVEAVAWLFQVKTTLAAALAYASLLVWMREVERPQTRTYLLSIALFFLSLLAKATTVTWPCVILGYVWWKRGRLTPADIRRTAPFFVIALVLGLNGVLWYERVELLPSEEVRSDGPWSRLASAGWAFWFYLYKALLPLDLTFVYPRWPIPFTRPAQFLPTAVLAIVLTLAWAARGKSYGRHAVAALGFYLIALFPVLGFANIYFMRFSLVADHFQYLAVIAVIAPLTEVAARALARVNPRAVAVFAVPLVALTVLTVRQNRAYASEDEIWRDTVRKNPDAWLAWLNLGLSLGERGRHDEAVTHFERSLALKPDNFEAMAQIAKDLDRRGREGDAVALLRRALEANPNAPSAVDQMTQILARNGRVQEAVDLCTRLLKAKPNLPAMKNNCAIYLQSAGRVEEAFALWRELAVLDRGTPLTPHGQAAIHNLASGLRDAGRPDEALPYYQRSAEVGYRAADSHFNLGVIHLNNGRLAEASAHLSLSVAMDASNAEAFHVRGLALQAMGELARACADFEKADTMGFAAAAAARSACRR